MPEQPLSFNKHEVAEFSKGSMPDDVPDVFHVPGVLGVFPEYSFQFTGHFCFILQFHFCQIDRLE
jgi:hypothetical protein